VYTGDVNDVKAQDRARDVRESDINIQIKLQRVKVEFRLTN